MKARILCRFLFIILGFIGCALNCLAQENALPMIGAYYFDGWSGENNSQEVWAQEAPTHLTWKLYDDYKERQPLWGWRDDDLAIMERQIDIASQNGITFFLFCWYWKKDNGDIDIKSIDNHSLHTSLKLFMKARNKHKMKFALLIANHQGARIKGENNWLKAMDYMADTYFLDSQYLKIENKPVVAFFDAKAAAPTLDKMSNRLKAKNYAGLFSISCNDKNKKYSANSWYNIREREPGYAYEKDYEILAKNAEVNWYTYPEEYNIIPLVMAGWDKRPWEKQEKSLYYVNRTPKLFKQHLKNAVKFVKERDCKPKMILIFAWNEYGEGGYVAPTLGDPKGKYLKMIKEVIH